MQLLVITVVFAAAFGIRLYHIDKPLFDFAPVRQYHSALLARGLYEWLLTGTVATRPPDGIIEPPILELLASCAYFISGAEHLWVPRLLSAAFWMGGGVFLYLIARKISSPNAAIFSTSFYLLAPGAVLPSRAFMPDSLMVMLLLVSVYAIYRYHEHPTSGRLLVAVAASASALLVKPGICVFQILGVFIALMIYRRGLLRSLTSVHLLLFTISSLLPVGLYYVYGAVISGFLQGQAQSKFVPQYLLESYYWRGWLEQIGIMAGYTALFGAVVGILLLRPGLPRALMAGLWGGYFLFGLVFTYHIHTHDYYSLPFVPVVALSLAPVWEAAARYVRRGDARNYRMAAVLLIAFAAMSFAVVEQRTTLLGIARQAQGPPPPARIADYEARANTYEEIGEIVDHSRRTIYSAPDFGYPLLYHGRLDGEYFPSPEMMAWWRSRGRTASHLDGAANREEFFDNLYAESSPEYFIVIRSEGWREDRLLRRLLTKHFNRVARDADYLVFDLRDSDYRAGSSRFSSSPEGTSLAVQGRKSPDVR